MSEPLKFSYVVPDRVDPMLQRLTVLVEVFKDMEDEREIYSSLLYLRGMFGGGVDGKDKD